MTDGVYEHVSEAFIVEALLEPGLDLDAAAARIARAAFDHGSGDNLTLQIVRVDELPTPSGSDILHDLSDLPFPPALGPRMRLDGYVISRELHASHRSHVYLALDETTQTPIVIKTPGPDVRVDERRSDHERHGRCAGTVGDPVGTPRDGHCRVAPSPLDQLCNLRVSSRVIGAMKPSRFARLHS